MKWALIIGGSVVAIVAFTMLRSSDAEASDAPPPGRNPVNNPDDEDAYALGRVLASEDPRGSEELRTWLAWAVVNMANRQGVSVTALVKQNTGGYSRQGGKGNWYCATGNEARAEDSALAALIIAGQVPDPTGGATNFDHPFAQRAALARNVDSYVKTPEEVAQNRRSSGLRLVLVPGIPEERFRLWAPT